MNEKRYTVGLQSKTIFDMKTELYLFDNKIICELLNAQNSLICEQQATITKLEQICEKKMQEIENIKYSLKEIAYKYQKEVQFKTDTDPNQAVKEVLCEQQATISRLEEENEQLKQEKDKYRVMINANASLNDEVYEQLKKTEKSYKECREENEQLQEKIEMDKNDFFISEAKRMIQDRQLKILKEENELLRQRNGELIHDCYGHLYSIRRVQDENKQLKSLLKEAEDEIENLKRSNKGLMESIVEKDEQINKLKKEVDEYKEAIINKVQYYEDIEDFAIKKGLIKKDWAKFDGYD